MEILKLRCVRCGDAHTREVGDPYTPELCGACFSKGLGILFAPGDPDTNGRRYDRWRSRWEKNSARHPAVVTLYDAHRRHGYCAAPPEDSQW